MYLNGGAIGPGPGFVVLAAAQSATPVNLMGSAQVSLSGLVYGDGLGINVSGNGALVVNGALVLGRLTTLGNASLRVMVPTP